MVGITDGGARVELVAGSGWWWAKAEGRGERVRRVKSEDERENGEEK